MQIIAIEIGGTKLQIVTGGPDGSIHQRQRFTVAPDQGATGIRAQIEAALRELTEAQRPDAVGIGFGGPVDWQTGRIACSHQIAGWSEFPLADWVSGLTGGVPVFVDNDANVGALGEALCGAGQGSNPVFYVTLGSGVGGGLVVNGAIYHGVAPGESEIGHVRLDKTGVIVEQRCSGWAVDRRIREAIRSQPDSRLAQLCAGTTACEAKFLGAALAEGDALARRILDDTAEDLAFALSHAVHLVHPEVIVLGGGLSLLGEPLRAAVERELPKFLMEVFGGGSRIVLARLREDAVPIGALLLAAARRRSETARCEAASGISDPPAAPSPRQLPPR